MSKNWDTGKTCQCDYCMGTGEPGWECGVVLDLKRELTKLRRIANTLQNTVDFYAKELENNLNCIPSYDDN